MAGGLAHPDRPARCPQVDELPHPADAARVTRRGRPVLLAFVGGDELLCPGRGVHGQDHQASREARDVDPDAQLLRQRLRGGAVGVIAHVDERRHDVAGAGAQRVQRADRVVDRAPGGQLVVDQHERRVPAVRPVGRAAEHVGLVGQQQVPGGVGVLLVETGGGPRPRDAASGGVQVRGAQHLRDLVRQARRRLGVPQHRGDGGRRVSHSRLDSRVEARHGARLTPQGAAEQASHLGVGSQGAVGDPPAQHLGHHEPQQPGGGADQPGVGGHVLAQDGGDQQVRSPRVAPKGQPDQQTHVGDEPARDGDDPHAEGTLDPRPGPPHGRRGRGPGAHGEHAANRSTKVTSGRATPNTWARCSVATAHDRWGLDSFILLR